MSTTVLNRARTVLLAESDAVRALADRLDSRFDDAVSLLLRCSGRVVTTGIGKAGAIARKLSATLSSTGTPALFLHPAEGVHGDLGVVTPDDVLIVLSYSGESDEVTRLLPALRRIGPSIIAVTGNPVSTLSSAADIVLDAAVDREACPLGLAPTTSAIAMLALGDALALCTMEARGFTRDDFAAFHPAGTLGRRLTLTVADVMRTGDRMAIASEMDSLTNVLCTITSAGAGAACLVDDDGRLAGLVTDGDFRRAIQANRLVLERPVCEIMNRTPYVISGNLLAAEALELFEEHPQKIGEAPVIDSDSRPVGMIMLKDLLRCGII